MPPPISDQLRADILRDIQDGLPRNQIARKRGVSPSTVTGIAHKARGPNAFDRSKTANATRARQIDTAAVRAELVSKLYSKANGLLDRVDAPYEQLVSGPLGTDIVTTALPPLRDAQAGMSGASVAIDRAGRLEDRLGDGASAAAASLLGALFDGLKAQYGDYAEPGG